MEGAHTKDHKPVAAAGDRDPRLIQRSLVRLSQRRRCSLKQDLIHSLCPEASVYYTWSCSRPDRTAVSAQLLVALPHLPLSARQPCIRRSAADHVIVRTGVCRSAGREAFFFFFFLYCRGSHWSQHSLSLQVSAASPQHGKKKREVWSVRWCCGICETWRAWVRKKKDSICSIIKCLPYKLLLICGFD